MRAILCSRLGRIGDLAVVDLPEPEPGPGEVQVAVAAMGVQFVDLLMVAGEYQHKPDLPFVPGLEAAGTVRKAGPGVAALRPGDRVITAHRPGAFAEVVTAPEAGVWPLPDGFGFVEGAAFRSAYHTAYHALVQRAALRSGETLLVHGASGGMGLAAVEIGKLLGATVIATGGSDAKLAVVRGKGADHVLNYAAGGLRDGVKGLTDGRGADVVFDPVGGDAFDESMRCLAWGARVLVIGFASGRRPTVAVNRVLIKGASILGVRAGQATRQDPSLLEDSRRTLVGWAAEGRIRPHVSHVLPMERVVEAFELLAARRVVGKVVLTTG